MCVCVCVCVCVILGQGSCAAPLPAIPCCSTLSARILQSFASTSLAACRCNVRGSNSIGYWIGGGGKWGGSGGGGRGSHAVYLSSCADTHFKTTCIEIPINLQSKFKKSDWVRCSDAPTTMECGRSISAAVDCRLFGRAIGRHGVVLIQTNVLAVTSR